MTEILGHCIFDSWTSEGAEVRSARSEERHLIYEGAGVILDLLLRQSPDGSRIHIGGQILPNDAHPRDVGDIPVSMECGRARSITRTNALGEFSFLTDAVSLGLSISFDNRKFKVHGLESPEPRMWHVVTSSAAGRGLR